MISVAEIGLHINSDVDVPLDFVCCFDVSLSVSCSFCTYGYQ
jgi:hypothetical protein